MKALVLRGLWIATACLVVAGCKNNKGGVEADNEDWGQHASMVLDASGRPHVAFYHRSHKIDDDREETVGALMYSRGALEGSSAKFSPQRVDGDVRREGYQNVGLYTSIALGSDGHPRISYYDKTGGDLKYAWHDGKSWRMETVDMNGDVGLYTDLALTSDNQPVIAYYDSTHGDLKLARFTGDTWNIQVVDDGAGTDVGKWPDLVLDGNTATIAYYDVTAGNLLLTSGDNFSFATTEIVDGTADTDVGRWASLVVRGADVHIAYEDYTNHHLKYAVREGGGAWNIMSADTSEWVGPDTSLVVDSNGQPHIAYFDGFNNDLKYAHFDGNGWLTSAVAQEGGNGYFNTLQIAEDGSKHFAYYSFENTNLNYVITQ